MIGHSYSPLCSATDSKLKIGCYMWKKRGYHLWKAKNDVFLHLQKNLLHENASYLLGMYFASIQIKINHQNRGFHIEKQGIWGYQRFQAAIAPKWLFFKCYDWAQL